MWFQRKNSVDKLVDFTPTKWPKTILLIDTTEAAEKFKRDFLERFGEKISTVAREVAELRQDHTIGSDDYKHVLRHAFERAMRNDE